MINYQRHLINYGQSVRDALKQMNLLAADAILFIVDDEDRLLGSLTDGDFRRGFINGLGFEDALMKYAQPNPKFVKRGKYLLKEIIDYRERNFIFLPLLDEQDRVIYVINFNQLRSYLPIDAVVMAGGRGERLRPLTDNTPKPLLPVGGKPIIEHNIDRLRAFGIDDIWISVKYLGEQIQSFFKDGSEKSVRIKYVQEREALGTAGALSLVDGFQHDTLLVLNSDILTNIDFEDFYLFFENEEADLAVACFPYQIKVPYAVMETESNNVIAFKEKPTYTHYSNAGIYMMKKDVVSIIPQGTHFNATDLMEKLIEQGKKVVAYPLTCYWLDIGRHDDYQKAQEDIKHLHLL